MKKIIELPKSILDLKYRYFSEKRPQKITFVELGLILRENNVNCNEQID